MNSSERERERESVCIYFRTVQTVVSLRFNWSNEFYIYGYATSKAVKMNNAWCLANTRVFSITSIQSVFLSPTLHLWWFLLLFFFKLCHHLAFSLSIFLLLLLFARIYYLYARKSIVIGKISLAQFILTTYFSERILHFIYVCYERQRDRFDAYQYLIRCVIVFHSNGIWAFGVRSSRNDYRRRVEIKRLFIQMHPQ